MKNIFLKFLFFLISFQLQAATYYVRKTGNDTNPGTTGSPWLTIGKAASSMVAGDTVIVGDGDYNEHVTEATSGTSGNLITYQAENVGLASLRAFRFSGQYIKVDGFTINKFSGAGSSFGAAVRLDSGAHNNTITNCTIKDMPYVIADDFSFNSATQTITSASSNFNTAGFVVGSKIYLGACGADFEGVPLYFVNHDQTWEVASLTDTTMTLTNGSAVFQPDTGTNYWAFIRSGVGNTGYGAIECFVSGGVGANNLSITNNTITNWPGHAIKIKGNNITVEGNSLSNLLSFRAFQFEGSNLIIRRNVVKDCLNIIHFSQSELDNLEHPASTGWYDYQVGMISGFVGSFTASTNVLIEENWFENIENQIGRVDDEQAGTEDITYQRNVFVGLTEHFSGGRDGMKWLDNTFFRCTFGGGAAHPLSIGGRAPQQSGYEISGNLFVACGRIGVSESSTRGFYTISSNALSPIVDGNFVASEELLGFTGKTNFSEATGVNGGNPVFYNSSDPDGTDNVPFTSDDGLKVVASSPAATLGGGALGVRTITTGQPVANFAVSSPNGWWEGTGESYDPTWDDIPPTDRGGPVRPYTTPPSFVGVPLTVTFDASKSISGVAGASTNTAISNYSWNFGDGSAVVNTGSTSVSHTFTTAGDRTVTLTVTNSSGGTASYSSVYRFPGPAKRVPQDYATVQLAVDSAVAGDVIILSAGTYNETVTTGSSGTSTDRITIEGETGAILKQLIIQNPYWTVRGIKFQGITAGISRYIWLLRGAHFTRIENCTINAGLINDVMGIEWFYPSTQPFGTDAPSDCVVTGVEIYDVKGTSYVTMMGDRNVLENCTFRDGAQVDFLRLFGRNNIIRNNSFKNSYYFPNLGNHPDFIQTFGNNGFGSQGMIIEKNIINYIQAGGLTQLEGNLVEEIEDWTFRNNIFIRVGNAASCTIPNVKYYNNVFYQCQKNNGGHVLAFGGRLYGKNSVSSSQPEKATLEVDVPSGSIVTDYWYEVVASGANSITYNGIVYDNGKNFKGVTGVTTYTETDPGVFVGRAMLNFAHGAKVKNNIFLDCGDGGNTKGWYGPSSTYGALTDTEFDYNYVAGAGYTLKRAGTAGYPDVGYDTGKFYEVNGINGGNPSFVDESIFDFRLLAGSILIDEGATVSAVPSDFIGITRPYGSAYDIGAYEFTDDGSEPPPPPVENLPPTAPSSLSSTAVGSTAITLAWADNSNNETGFEIQRSLDQTSWTTSKTTGVGVISANDTGLVPETLYYFRVRSFNANGFSAWSNTSSTTTEPTPPVKRRFPRGNRRAIGVGF